MSDNRLEALAAFLASNPDLPQGSDTPAQPEPAEKLPVLTMSIERKGRGGKTATILTGFASEAQAADTASKLKKRLATGGSARACEVLVQGDRRADLRVALRALGFPAPKG
ncbi:MAG: translation initiation factor [Muribaculaceae bacterium]|nr:translation initiation factor [Muribaculaceae bacterium]